MTPDYSITCQVESAGATDAHWVNSDYLSMCLKSTCFKLIALCRNAPYLIIILFCLMQTIFLVKGRAQVLNRLTNELMVYLTIY
jgi:hypothetical protein